MTTLRPRRRLIRALAFIATVLCALAALVAWLNVRGEQGRLEPFALAAAATPSVLERGAYLARAGNCMGCHTTAGGAEYAGGRGVQTPFGTVFAPNITPHAESGIGTWSSAEFWRAMHHGRSKDGRLLYPAFPYPSYTTVTREDSDALYAYLRNSVEAVAQADRRHELRFPFGTQAALAVWRALYFRPKEFVAEPQHSAAWNRGKYLVEGLGHCIACHSSRNVLGATSLNGAFTGGVMPDETWYAPSLARTGEAGVQDWPRADIVKLLKDGVTTHASVAGPMADVVHGGTQYLSGEDLDAMAQFLASIPASEPQAKEIEPAPAQRVGLGGKLYEKHCASCHGDQGQGVPTIYPPLAGNRAVTIDSPNNLVQIIRKGAFAPSTTGNPRPFGMPPFGQILDHDEVAALTTYIRQSWGNSAPPVSPLEVLRVK